MILASSSTSPTGSPCSISAASSSSRAREDIFAHPGASLYARPARFDAAHRHGHDGASAPSRARCRARSIRRRLASSIRAAPWRRTSAARWRRASSRSRRGPRTRPPAISRSERDGGLRAAAHRTDAHRAARHELRHLRPHRPDAGRPDRHHGGLDARRDAGGGRQAARRSTASISRSCCATGAG